MDVVHTYQLYVLANILAIFRLYLTLWGTYTIYCICGVFGGWDLTYNDWGVWINIKKVTICDANNLVWRKGNSSSFLLV